MVKKNLFLILGIFLVGTLFISLGSSATGAFSGATSSSGFSGSTSSNWQSYQPTFNQLYSGSMDTYWPIIGRMDSSQCNETMSDFIISIPVGGCSPGVVRSDLLEEQNVPVFCQLYAMKINPLIKVSSIKSISFKGDYPEGVSSVVFHPARAAVKSYRTLVGDPTLENIGYVVIILKREKVEDKMEEWIAGNLTATIYYDAEEAYGTGRAEYYLPILGDSNWTKDYQGYSFWNGLGYLRVKQIGDGSASIQILRDKDYVVRTLNLKEGETSELVYLPGFYCRAGLRVKLDELAANENSVLLNIDGNEIWAREGNEILNGLCKVNSLEIIERENVTTKIKEKVGADIRISCPGSSKLDLKMVKRDGELKIFDKDFVDDDLDDNFVLANSTTSELVLDYPSEMKENGAEAYGEESLIEQIDLAGTLGKLSTQKTLRELFLETYPSSRSAEKIRFDLRRSQNYEFNESYGNIYVANKFHSISLLDYKAEDKGMETVDLRIDGKDYSRWKEGTEETVGENEKISVTKVSPGKVSLKYVKEKKSETKTFTEGKTEKLGSYEIYVKKVSIVESAHVSLLPEVSHTKTEASFTYKIGIEKRNIELTPDKTSEMIKNLNKTIEKWEGITERLGNLIKAWKGACFATSALLITKNMISGFSGESLARQKVMTKYKAICDTQYGHMSRTECYNKLSPKIDAEVASMTSALSNVNNKMKTDTAKYRTDGGLIGDGSIVDQEKYENDLKNNNLANFNYIVEVNGENVTLNKDDLDTTSQIQTAMLYQQVKGTASEDIAKSELDKVLRNVAYTKQMKEGAAAAAATIGGNVQASEVLYVSTGKEITNVWSGKKEGGENVQYIHYGGKNYKLVLGKSVGGVMEVKSAKEIGVGADPTKDVTSTFSNFNFISAGSSEKCTNPWPSGKAAVSYYESGNNKGLPAIVPFDLKNGWYAKVPNGGGTFLDNSQAGYTQSGDVGYFHICNIGSNKLMESGSGDDLCQSFSTLSAGSVDTFIPCRSLSAREVTDLYETAREAVRQASQQYGQKTINIMDQLMDAGQPMSEVTGYECQDFMSPDDCKWMFNVCDPVICPPSRCDLGGKMPVSDVIQTGIVGSIFLCLPNYKEGIMVPICVSGIHAGIEGYLSILKSERDCLQTSLATGEHVGICDEITSIYMCEFFWRQLSPVMDMIVPRLVEGLYGGSRTRGGGEYLLVQNAWDTTQKSIDYFQNTYATNAFRAFKMRSVEEAGSTVCRAFVGSSFPTSADAFDELLEPESPSQFYAQFSEILFTEATVPATSQYKVYYHIFAGNDKGVQYKIYIKSPPESSYYRANPTVIVKSGYVAKGQSVDWTEDFTAPSGYKELCVVIDAKEECGFKQVTTEFGLDYLTKKYTEEQATATDIATEEECISGSPSVLSTANLNVQAGAEEVLNPEIALRGIIRVCASSNPGEGIDSKGYVLCTADGNECGKGYSCRTSDDNSGYCASSDAGLSSREVRYGRWKDVGSCGSTTVRCWLDTDSVKNDLESLEAIEGSSISLLNEKKGLIENGQISYEQVQTVLANNDLKIKKITNGDVIEFVSNSDGNKIETILLELDSIIGTTDSAGSGTNANRAEALALKASVYRRVVQEIFYKNPEVVQAVVASRETVSATVPEVIEETTTNVEEVLWGVNEKNEILYNKVITSYSLNKLAGQNDLAILTTRGRENVGSISVDGVITIREPAKKYSLPFDASNEGKTLGDLGNYIYDSDEKVFVKNEEVEI